MPDNTTSNKRIAKNTIMLYCRMAIMMIVSLYTSRVVLSALGVEDYGVYNIVGGIVPMFSLLSASLSTAINRFLTFELGRGDIESLRRVFSTSITIQALLSIVIIVLAETIGLWYVNKVMVVPLGRLAAANWCYQFSIITFVVNLMSVPYNSLIISHEKMSLFAWIGIFEGMSVLGIALIISVSSFDRLILYGALLCILYVIIRFIYTFYCNRHFEEVKFKISWDKEMLHNMLGFAGWNFIGAGSRILRDYGVNILLNFFHGPVVNAARGLSNSVNGAVSRFSENFIMAVNPQITKSYANNETESMFKLIFRSSRFSVFLLLLLSAPILLNTSFILSIWLTEVPDHTSLFIKLVLIYMITEAISYPLVTAMLATGDIKNYQLIVGGFQCLNFPLAWIALKCGLFPESVIVVSIFIAHCCFISRLIMLKKMIGLDAKAFFFEVYIRVILVAMIGLLIPLILRFIIPTGWSNFIIVTLCSVCAMSVSVLFVGCDKVERKYIRDMALSYIRRFRNDKTTR